jgi:hypothetical protein
MMKMTFYDVKMKKKVDAEVTEKKEYQVNGQTRYALKAKTADGRPLTRFASKADYDAVEV